MTRLTRSEWTQQRMAYLAKRSCPRCGSKMHDHQIAEDGIVTAYCHYVNATIQLPRIRVPATFKPEESEFPLYHDAQGNERPEY